MSVKHHYLKILPEYSKEGYVIMAIKVIRIVN